MKEIIKEITFDSLVRRTRFINDTKSYQFMERLLKEDNSIYNKYIINPQTSNKIRIKSALSYPKDSVIYKQAIQMVNAFKNKNKLQQKVDAKDKLIDILKNHDFYYQYIDPGRKDTQHSEWKKHFDNEKLMKSLMLFVGKTKAESIWNRYSPKSQKFPHDLFTPENKLDNKLQNKPKVYPKYKPQPQVKEKSYSKVLKKEKLTNFYNTTFDKKIEDEGDKLIQNVISLHLKGNKSLPFLTMDTMKKKHPSLYVDDEKILSSGNQRILLNNFVTNLIEFWKNNGKNKDLINKYANAKTYRKYIKLNFDK